VVDPAAFIAGLLVAARMLHRRRKPPRALLKQEKPRIFASFSGAKTK
jgi:hypothetical protein